MDLLDKINHEDKELLKRSWAVLEKNINDTAYCIFDMIFNQSPDTKSLSLMSLHTLYFLPAHLVLESVVKALDNPASLDPLCDNLGRVHGRLTDSRGFKPHHWGVFIECTLFHFRRVLATVSFLCLLHSTFTHLFVLKHSDFNMMIRIYHFIPLGPLRMILYADDIALVADNQEELEQKVQLWQRALADNGLRLNVKKTKFISSEQCAGSILDCQGETIEKVKEFRHLGSDLSEEGSVDQAVR
ncbi:unnamed protein product, partial [Heligmosomoides polygyrus]